jgi:stearoyl-CoA desaturase (delta-9 desaturase)
MADNTSSVSLLDGPRMIPSAHVRTRQLWTALLLLVLPALGTGYTIWRSIELPPSVLDLTLLFGMWAWVLGFGVSVGFHRCFSHHSFEAGATLRVLMGLAGSMAFQGSVLYWVCIHRRHHQYIDSPGDPHSPAPTQKGRWSRLKSLWHAHFWWMATHSIPSPLYYAPDLLKDPLAKWLTRYYLPISLLGFFLPAGIGGLLSATWEGAFTGLLWGGIVRQFLCTHLTGLVNSVCHSFGHREFDIHGSTGNSRNMSILAVPTFGESWHNGHHSFPTSARFSRCWWQLDLGYVIIRILVFLRMARNAKRSRRTTGPSTAAGGPPWATP